MAGETPVLAARLNGMSTAADGPEQDYWGVRYYELPVEGIELMLTIPSGEPLSIRLMDQSLGLLEALDVSPSPPMI